MKAWLLLVLFFMCLQSRAQSPGTIDIVFDIDWTTFYSIDPADQNQTDGNTLAVEGKYYRATDHLGEVLQTLLRHPEIRISFFSGGEESRNKALLENLKLPDGRSAADIAYKILSKSDLTQVSTEDNLKFAEKFKKIITGKIPGAIPERTLLIDDEVKFAVSPWKAVSSLGVFKFQKSFDSTKVTQSYYPPSADAWQEERDKALKWLALIEEALAVSHNAADFFSQFAVDLWSTKSANPLCKDIFAP